MKLNLTKQLRIAPQNPKTPMIIINLMVQPIVQQSDWLRSILQSNSSTDLGSYGIDETTSTKAILAKREIKVIFETTENFLKQFVENPP